MGLPKIPLITFCPAIIAKSKIVLWVLDPKCGVITGKYQITLNTNF